MKKILKLCIVLSFILMVTGCVKVEFSMGIHKDKSMDMSIIEAVDTSFFGDDDSVIDKEQIDSFEKKGFLVRDYNEDSMKGYTFTKTFENIDFLSTENSEYVADLNNILKRDDVILFSIKKGFLKNTYVGKFNISSEDLVGDSNTQMPEGSNGEMLEGFDYEQLMKGMNLNFVVQLPYKVVSSNATTISDNQKVLTWNLLEMSNQPVQFEFNLYNMTNVYIVTGILLIVLFWIIVLIVKIISNIKPSNFRNVNNNNNNNNNNSSESIYYSNSNDNIYDNANTNIDNGSSFINTSINNNNLSNFTNIDNTDNNNNSYFSSQSFGFNSQSEVPTDNNNLSNNIPLSELNQSNTNNQIPTSGDNEFFSLGLDSVSYNPNQSINNNQSNMNGLNQSTNLDQNISNNIFIQDIDKSN